MKDKKNLIARGIGISFGLITFLSILAGVDLMELFNVAPKYLSVGRIVGLLLAAVVYRKCYKRLQHVDRSKGTRNRNNNSNLNKKESEKGATKKGAPKNKR